MALDEIVRVHDLATVLRNPEDVGAKNLRAILKAASGDVFVIDADTSRKYQASLDASGHITITPIEQA